MRCNELTRCDVIAGSRAAAMSACDLREALFSKGRSTTLHRSAPIVGDRTGCIRLGGVRVIDVDESALVLGKVFRRPKIL